MDEWGRNGHGFEWVDLLVGLEARVVRGTDLAAVDVPVE